MVVQKLLSVLLVTALVNTAVAQGRYFTKNGKIDFVSKGNIETIEAIHKSVTCVLDAQTGNLQFAVLMKGFEFEKALMQEHFNENYVESDKYPKAAFKGNIVNNSEINYTKAGNYTARVKGKLTIHGVTREVETTGKVTVTGNGLDTDASFVIQLSDYKIKIPGVVSEKINNTVTIKVDCSLEPLKR